MKAFDYLWGIGTMLIGFLFLYLGLRGMYGHEPPKFVYFLAISFGLFMGIQAWNGIRKAMKRTPAEKLRDVITHYQSKRKKEP